MSTNKYNVFILSYDNEIYQYGKNVHDIFGFKSNDDIYYDKINYIYTCNNNFNNFNKSTQKQY